MNGNCRPIIAPSVVGRQAGHRAEHGHRHAERAEGDRRGVEDQHEDQRFERREADRISSELVMATGVPKPATPSSSAPKQKPITTSTTRRSFGRCSIDPGAKGVEAARARPRYCRAAAR